MKLTRNSQYDKNPDLETPPSVLAQKAPHIWYTLFQQEYFPCCLNKVSLVCDYLIITIGIHSYS